MSGREEDIKDGLTGLNLVVRGSKTTIISTYDKTAEDAVEPCGMAHKNENPALPCPIEGRLVVPLLKISELGGHIFFKRNERGELSFGIRKL